MKISILTIGDELLIGQIIDTNSAWIGQQITALGGNLVERRTVGDAEEEIIDALTQLAKRSEAVIVTGGLGPTKDDVTKKALARFLGVDLYFDQNTYDRIEKIFERYNRKMSDSHKAQCYMPEGTILLANEMGTAPGMQLQYNKTRIYSLPGVPYEMKYIMENSILPDLMRSIGGDKMVTRTIMTAGVGETVIEDEISDIVGAFDDRTSIAYLPSLGTVRLRITVRGDDTDALKKKADDTASLIADKLGKFVYGFDEISIMECVQQMCTARGLWVGTAESCSGGLISHLITSIPGSSEYYKGSVIAYANEVKQSALGVNPDTIREYGVVSEEVVIQMAKGCLEKLGVDLAVSVSGIAGPGGGSLEKPVGTTWICIADNKRTFSFMVNAAKDRKHNIEYAANAALNNLRLFVMKHYPEEILQPATPS